MREPKYNPHDYIFDDYNFNEEIEEMNVEEKEPGIDTWLNMVEWLTKYMKLVEIVDNLYEDG